MNFEIILGIVVILGFAIWAAIYIHRRTKENNNTHLFDFIPHLFPTLGILFTFLGIAIGLWNFDSNNIEKSIPELMNGLKTAFLVSIFGVALLVLFSFWTNNKRKKLEEGLVSDETQAINKLIESINHLREELSSTDQNGNRIKAGNIFRDLYNESLKQSNSLQSFSSDLAITIEAGFQKILNDPSEGVVAELKLVRTEIESLGNKLKDPATDMTQNIVKELQESMGKMIEEFKTSMSGDTKNEMEHLAKLLGQAGGSLADFPSKLQNMTDNLNENFKGLQEVVQQISQQTLSQSQDSTNAMKKQVEEMSEVLRIKVGDLQSGQHSLLTEQSKNLEVSESLLNAFNSSIQMMNGLTSEVNGSITKLYQAQLELDKVVSIFKNVSQDINSSSNKFGESQNEFSKYTNQFLHNNASTIVEIQKSLEMAKGVSSEYVQKFTIIEGGLKNIFSQLNDGLITYEQTVSENIRRYLSEFTTSLTETAKTLGGASHEQKEILQELSDLLDELKKR